MKKIFSALASLLLFVGCVPDNADFSSFLAEKNGSNISQQSASAEDEWVNGIVETDDNGVSTFICPVFSISETGSWSISCAERYYKNEHYVSFTNTSTQQGNVAVIAYTGDKKSSPSELLEKQGFDIQNAQNTTFLGYDALYVTSEVTANKSYRTDYYVFETDKAVFEVGEFFYRDSSFYENDKGSAELLLSGIEVY